MAGPLIVTSELAPEDFAWLNDLRRRHYPADRNRVPAHLIMFHAIAPSAEAELRQILRTMSSESPPHAWIAGIMNLGGGVAFRIASEGLDRLRAENAHRLR
jgi:hypothetical protein